MIYYPQASTTYDFAGPMNNGLFIPLTNFTTDNGFNLVPNPYPSAIDWDVPLGDGWTKTGIDDAVYIWPSGAGAGANATNYASYVGGVGTNGGSRYIASGQSFFIHANSVDPELNMDNRVRLHNPVAFLKETESISNLLRISCTVNGSTDETVVRFTEETTNGFDGYQDAYKMQGGADAPRLFSIASDQSDLSINSLPFSTEPVIVPVKFSLSSSGEVTITANGMESFNANSSIYLEDLVSGSMVNLREQPVYTFSYQEGSTTDRFKLHFGGPIEIEENSPEKICAYSSHGIIYISIPGMNREMANITVYNSIGQIQSSQSVMMNGITSIDAPSVNGVILLNILTAKNNI
jgi:hypothetical protein